MNLIASWAIAVLGVASLSILFLLIRANNKNKILNKKFLNEKIARSAYRHIITTQKLFNFAEIESYIRMIENKGGAFALLAENKEWGLIIENLKIQYSLLLERLVCNQPTISQSMLNIFKWNPKYLVNYDGYGSQTLGEKTQKAILSTWKVYLESLEKLSEVKSDLEHMKKFEEPFPQEEGFSKHVKEYAENRSSEIVRALLVYYFERSEKQAQKENFGEAYTSILMANTEIGNAILSDKARATFEGMLKNVLTGMIVAIHLYLSGKEGEDAVLLNRIELQMRELTLKLAPPEVVEPVTA